MTWRQSSFYPNKRCYQQQCDGSGLHHDFYVLFRSLGDFARLRSFRRFLCTKWLVHAKYTSGNGIVRSSSSFVDAFAFNSFWSLLDWHFHLFHCVYFDVSTSTLLIHDCALAQGSFLMLVVCSIFLILSIAFSFRFLWLCFACIVYDTCLLFLLPLLLLEIDTFCFVPPRALGLWVRGQFLWTVWFAPCIAPQLC